MQCIGPGGRPWTAAGTELARSVGAACGSCRAGHSSANAHVRARASSGLRRGRQTSHGARLIVVARHVRGRPGRGRFVTNLAIIHDTYGLRFGPQPCQPSSSISFVHILRVQNPNASATRILVPIHASWAAESIRIKLSVFPADRKYGCCCCAHNRGT